MPGPKSAKVMEEAEAHRKFRIAKTNFDEFCIKIGLPEWARKG